MYALIDSGEGEKLEQFGDLTLIRPSSLCIWKKRRPDLWAKAAARFRPKAGWESAKGAREEWSVTIEGCVLQLRLQKNGQIGVFPEHATYLNKISEFLRNGRNSKVLNLFAYTGLATLTALKMGAQVTHIDALKPALDWAKHNIELNKLSESSYRLIPEEALTFAKREVKRGNRYDLIIADPPSFSRISKSQEWDLFDVLPGFVSDLVMLLNPGGAIFFTCHLTDAGPAVIENLLMDSLPQDKKSTLQSSQLFLQELESPRKIPAGFLITVYSSDGG